jgi:calcineurin-like phosphoesterase family protein
LLVVTFAAVTANALLYFVYLSETSSVSTNDPGGGAKRNHPEGFPRLERRGEIYATPNTLPAPTGDPMVVGAGDIAVCGANGDDATSELIEDMPNATVVTLGDHAFEDGTASEFTDCYGPSWGRFEARTMPTVGNHDYQTPGASGYFGYFGAAAGDPDKGYYSYDLGRWHVVSLNSMCGNAASEYRQPGGCEPGSPMVTWLEQDLAANPTACTLATFHHPLFNSGNLGNHPNTKPIWDALYAADADVVLNAHQHTYERFAPQTPGGVTDSTRGIREFVVGTGGASHEPFGTIKPNSQVRNADTYGVLRLTLHANGYEWEFVPEAGKTFTDSGTDECH